MEFLEGIWAYFFVLVSIALILDFLNGEFTKWYQVLGMFILIIIFCFIAFIR